MEVAAVCFGEGSSKPPHFFFEQLRKKRRGIEASREGRRHRQECLCYLGADGGAEGVG
jgi:hypothetical protein